MDIRQFSNEAIFNEFFRRQRCSELPERRVIFIGPPGAGKGTHAPKMSEEYCLCHLATGDMLRKISSENSPFGRQIKAMMDRGELVSDELILEPIVREIEAALSRPSCLRGIVLDGFPRTLVHATRLDEIIQMDGVCKTLVLELKIDENLLIERISGRRVHPASGRSYHVKFNPPKTPDRDDVTGEPLTQRKDDNEEALKTRLTAYNQQTVPVLQYYRQKSLLTSVNADQAIDAVWREISGALNK